MTNRIEWIDTSKALAIFCVVFGHVEIFGMDHYFGFWNRFQDVFCMPLFFLISGMFCKTPENIKQFWGAFKKKSSQLLLPFVACGMVYTIILVPQRPWWSLFYFPEGEWHNGYWFLIVLFCLYGLWWLSCFLCMLLRTKNIEIMSGVIFALLWCILTMTNRIGIIPEKLNVILCIEQIKYQMPYFLTGHIVMNFNGLLDKLLSKWAFSICSLLMMVLFYIREAFGVKLFPISYILITCSVLTIFWICKKWTSEGSLGCVNTPMRFIGKHTLEIYVLHYFFLPRDIVIMSKLIAPGGTCDVNIVVELFLSTIVAIGVIVITLLCGAIIRITIFSVDSCWGQIEYKIITKKSIFLLW